MLVLAATTIIEVILTTVFEILENSNTKALGCWVGLFSIFLLTELILQDSMKAYEYCYIKIQIKKYGRLVL